MYVVGNAILPLVELNPMLQVIAVDFARSAVDILKTHPLYSSTGRVDAFVCDVANDLLPVSNNSLDFALCMYVLSAVPPEVGNNHLIYLSIHLSCMKYISFLSCCYIHCIHCRNMKKLFIH
jgi:hypothetical protein